MRMFAVPRISRILMEMLDTICCRRQMKIVHSNGKIGDHMLGPIWQFYPTTIHIRSLGTTMFHDTCTVQIRNYGLHFGKQLNQHSNLRGSYLGLFALKDTRLVPTGYVCWFMKPSNYIIYAYVCIYIRHMMYIYTQNHIDMRMCLQMVTYTPKKA